MRLKTGRNDKLRFKKVVAKDDKGSTKKKHWKNECELWILAIGEPLSFRGNVLDKQFNWESKDEVENFSVNKRGIRIETESEIYYFDFVKEETVKKERPKKEDLDIIDNLEKELGL